MLSLMEELLLLALKNDKGTVSFAVTSSLPVALIGSVLMELELMGRVKVEEKITLLDDTLAGDILLDNVLDPIIEAKKEKKTSSLISSLSWKLRNMDKQIAGRLVEKGVLQKVEDTILWIFPTTNYPTANPQPEEAVRQRIRDTVMSGNTADERTRRLLVLVRCCEMEKSIFDEADLKTAKKRIKELTEDDPIGKAIRQVMDDNNAATVAAIT